MPAGNYTVTVSDINGCSIVDSFTLTQPDELLVSISPDQALCEGQVTNVSSQAVGGTEPYIYYWDSGNGFIQNSNVITVSPNTTTTYIVYVEDANGCQSSPASMTMTISPKIYMTLTTEDNRCFNSCDGAAQLHIDGGIPPFSYSWASSGSVFEDLCSGLYTVTITDILGCYVDTVFFIDEPSQIFANTYTTDASCFGYDDGQAVVEAVGGVPGYTYLWPNGSQNDSVNVGAGTHEVTITDAHDCRLTMEAVVEEPDELYVQLVGGDRWICKTNTTELNSHAIGGTPYYDFFWSGDDGTNYIINNPEVTPDTTTTYTVTVVDSHGCSSNMSDVTVNVFPDLLIENVSTSYDSICPGSGAIVEVNVSGGTGGPYSMTLQDGQVVPAPFTIYPTETTMYQITLHDQCGSPTVTDSIEIVVMPEPGNSFVSNKVEGCPPLPITFSEMTADEDQTYLWNFGDNGFGYVKNPTHTYKDGGQYSVTLTVRSEFGCENTVTIPNMINIFPSPYADFYTDNDFVSVLDPEVQFFNVSELADSSFWFFGDGDSSLFVNPSHNFDNVGEYEIRLIVESQNGCKDTAAKIINVRDEFTFYAPTAFTPNGDGENDFFMIFGNGIDPNEFDLIIYNRWGELIYETEIYDLDRPIEAAWDGTYQGNHFKGDELLQNGVYYWYCKFKDYTGIWHEEEGTVSLIR
jgi:gliding motility-associated-like protein